MDDTSHKVSSENNVQSQSNPGEPAGQEASAAGADAAQIEPGDISLGRIIQELRAGRLSIRNVSVSDRRACIMHLTAEGFSRTEIAAVLGVGDRTITRDRAAIRREQKLRANPELADQMGGELVRQADTSIEHIRRTLRDPNAAPQVRIQAHILCFKIACDLVKTLQSLGHLPSATVQVRADMTHRTAGPMTLVTVRAELERIRMIQQECRPDDPQLLRDYQMFESTLTALCQLDGNAAH